MTVKVSECDKQCWASLPTSQYPNFSLGCVLAAVPEWAPPASASREVQTPEVRVAMPGSTEGSCSQDMQTSPASSPEPTMQRHRGRGLAQCPLLSFPFPGSSLLLLPISCHAQTENKRSKAYMQCQWAGLSSPETSVYYFKKTELISLKQGRQAPPPFSGWSMWFHVTGWRLSLGNGSAEFLATWMSL